MLVHDTGLIRSVRNIDETDKKRHFIVFVEAFPYILGKGIDIIRNRDRFRLSRKAGERVSVSLVCMDKMAFSRDRLVLGIGKPYTAFFPSLIAFQDGQCIRITSIGNLHHTRDPGCKIRSVRLKLPASQ